jgi:hypothetical protein
VEELYNSYLDIARFIFTVIPPGCGGTLAPHLTEALDHFKEALKQETPTAQAGLTPRLLLEQRDELLKVVRRVADSYNGGLMTPEQHMARVAIAAIEQNCERGLDDESI